MASRFSDNSYFMSHILPVYKRATVWDDNMCWIGQGAGCVYSYEGAMRRHKQYIVGSCSDGGCSPRLYRTPPVMEMDRLILIDGTGNQYGQPHPEMVGVYVSTESRQEYWDYVATSRPFFVCSPSADSPQHVHDTHHKAQDVLKGNPLYYPKWYDSVRSQISNSNKGPSMKFSLTARNTHIQMDQVQAYHHQGWPQEAEEWRTRARLWPPASVVEQVLQQGYQVVPKFSSSTGGIEGPMEFHITFAMCERYLAKQRTPVQKLVYLMAKTIFYTYLDLHDDTNPNIEFPSYALKTSMMWLMEQTPVDRWTEDNVLFLLRELLIHLKASAVNGTLTNYFMIRANILSNCTPNLLFKVEKQISQILYDMNKCLQGTELYKGNILLYGFYISMGGIKAYNKVVYQCQNKVLCHGLPEAIKQKYKVRATYQCIIEILERGTGEGLKARGYLFDEEECFHILKSMTCLYSDVFTNYHAHDKYFTGVRKILGRYPLHMDNLKDKVLCLSQHLPEPEVTIIRLRVQWQSGTLVSAQIAVGCGNRPKEVAFYLQHNDEWNHKILQGIRRLPGETDVIVVREGQDINVYKWSDIGDLLAYNNRDLWDNEAGRWWPKIYSLTHRDIPEVQLMDYARMLYLLYVCDDKIDQQYIPKKGHDWWGF